MTVVMNTGTEADTKKVRNIVLKIATRRKKRNIKNTEEDLHQDLIHDLMFKNSLKIILYKFVI